MAFIRWWGLAAFAVTMVLVFLLTWWVLPLAIHSLIEDKLSQLWGAKIELSDVSLSPIPLVLQLQGLQVTNPEQPERNSFEFDHAHLLLNPSSLLMGQLHIEHAALKGMRWDTQRSSSGALAEASSEAAPAQEESSLKEQLPDVKQLIDASDSLTAQRIAAFKAYYPAKMAELKALRGQLPDKAKLKAYEAELKALTQGKIKDLEDFQLRKQKFDALKQQLRQERALVKKVQEEHQAALAETKRHIALIKQGPKDDIARLKSQFAGQQPELFKLSQMVLDGRAQAYLNQAKYWLAKLQALQGEEEAEPEPKIGDKGRFVYFAGTSASPDFWLKRMDLDAQLERGDVEAQLLNATWQQKLIGKTTELKVKANDLAMLQSLSAKADLDLRDLAQIKGAASGRFGGYQLAQQALEQLPDMQLSSDNISGDFDAQLTGLQLELNVDSQWRAVTFASEAENPNTVAVALSQIKQFDASLALAQGPDKHGLSFKSDLDRQLKGILKQKVDAKLQQWQGELQQGLNAKVQQALAGQGEGDLEQQQQSLAAQEDEYQELLKTQLADYKKQQQDKLEGKLKDKLKDLF